MEISGLSDQSGAFESKDTVKVRKIPKDLNGHSSSAHNFTHSNLWDIKNLTRGTIK
jgi:hypothetical protein